MKLRQLAKAIQAELLVPQSSLAERDIHTPAPIQEAREGQITFVGSEFYEQFLTNCRAGAVILPKAQPELLIPQLVHQNPYYAFAKASSLLIANEHPFCGISPEACISPDATISSEATIAPFVFIGSRAVIESGVVLYPGCYVGDEVRIGAESVLYANVSIGSRCELGQRLVLHAGTVIGSDGFGFARGTEDIAKIPHTGHVIVEDDVEMGACCTVDRATMGVTRIGRGCKFDNHVHIAHNATIGENCLFAAQTGVSGSTVVGSRVTCGGNVGISSQLKIDDDVVIGAKAGVTKSLTQAGTYMGFPSIPASQWRRAQVALRRLPELEKRLRQLEKRLGEDSL